MQIGIKIATEYKNECQMKNVSKRKITIQILILFSLLFVEGCEKIQLGESSDYKIGTKYRINNNLSFTIDSLRDYRCPRDLMCIWSGDVELYFNIKHNLTDTDTAIYLYTRNNNPFKFDDYTLKIEEVNPWLKSGENIQQSDYRIKILLTKD